jgi:hypothetical protein
MDDHPRQKQEDDMPDLHTVEDMVKHIDRHSDTFVDANQLSEEMSGRRWRRDLGTMLFAGFIYLCQLPSRLFFWRW